MTITEFSGPFGRYLNIKGKGYDLSIRMEKQSGIESLMHAASEMRKNQFRLQGLAEMLDDAASLELQKLLKEQT